MTAARPLAVLSGRYRRALDIAVVVVAAGWQVGGAGTQLTADRAAYRSVSVQVAVWFLLTVIVVIGSVRLLRGQTGARGAWPLAGVALAAGTVAAAACPPAAMLRTDWAWGAVGWAGVLVLLRRPVREVAGFLSMAATVTFVILLEDGLHRMSLAGFLTVLTGSTGIQFAVVVASRALESVARQAAEAAENETAAREHAVTTGQLYTARLARWQALQATVVPLLHDLATGEADPGDAEVRRRCAVESARLRRVLAESDETGSPLTHELSAAADVAERRGVVVDVESAGPLPPVPVGVRRIITDTAIAVLVEARSRVRITLTGTGRGIAVSLHADAPSQPQLTSCGAVVIEQAQDGADLWLEARWNEQ